MARLIKTDKEVEGNYTEQWLVVEEDALDPWPAGPLETVGKPAERIDGLERARGQARYTADVRLPGMLHTAVLRSAHARARLRALDCTRALEAPGVRGVLTPADLDTPRYDEHPGDVGAGPGPHPSDVLTAEPSFEGAAVAAVAADTLAKAQAAVLLLDADWEVLEPLLDGYEAVRRGSLLEETENYERGDFERALAEADVVVEAEYRTQTVLHNSLETHQSVCEWHGDGRLDVHISTQWIWGVRRRIARELGLPADRVRVVCEYMGGGFGSKNGPGDYTFIAAELARRTGRPVRCALTRREENLATGNRNGTIQRLVA